jgi:poly-gamma-glutamate synthesis protein (capsule biosynthesis protein)
MSRKILKSLLVICCALLVAELVFLGVMLYREKESTPETTPATTQAPTTEETAATSEAATIPETTTPPTEAETEPTETEPKEIRYTLTFAGDCTLAADPGNYASPHGFIQTIGTDYGYPFRNVVEFFENDDFTIINLESVLANEGAAANKLFTFRGPTAYTEIMTGSSVEAVTLANNHTADYVVNPEIVHSERLQNHARRIERNEHRHAHFDVEHERVFSDAFVGG